MNSRVLRTPTQLLRMRASETPRAVAYAVRVRTGQWKYWRWCELWEQVQQAARKLRELGLQPGDYLAILANTGAEWFIGEHAGMLLGAVVIGIDRYAAPATIEHILTSTRPKILLVDGSANELPTEILGIAEQTMGFHKLSLMDEGEALRRSCPKRELPSTGDAEFPEIDGSQSATLVYTSGTTGTPKAIEFTQQQLMDACAAIFAAYPDSKPGESTLCWLPMNHMFQRMMNLLAIARGTTIHFVNDPRDVLVCAAEVQPTVFVGVPRFFEKLRCGIEQKISGLPPWRRRLAATAFAVAAQNWEAHQAGCAVSWKSRLTFFLLDRVVLSQIRRAMGSRIKFMVTGSAPIARHHLEFFWSLGWPVLEAYGISENCIPMAANRRDRYRLGSVGVPFPQNTVRFGRDGEIMVKGPGVFTGYWREDSMGDQFTYDGFYKTGDIGELDEDGFLYLLGRKSEMIKTSTGRKVFPSAIESLYQEHSLIDKVVVFGEGRPHLVGLITVEKTKVCQRLGIEPSAVTMKSLICDRRVAEMMRLAMQEQGNKLAPHHRIARYTLLAEPFNIATGELTTNLKVRRHIIAAKFANCIERMYGDSSLNYLFDKCEPVCECPTYS
jgi:long-chain acyl-CoA synthetase